VQLSTQFGEGNADLDEVIETATALCGPKLFRVEAARQIST